MQTDLPMPTTTVSFGDRPEQALLLRRSPAKPCSDDLYLTAGRGEVVNNSGRQWQRERPHC